MPSTSNGYHTVKRMLDFVGALLALLVLSPIFAVVAVLVLVFLGSPVFFTQQRVTKGERVFRLWKFRTMLNADPARGLITDAQRLTRFGRLLRSSSLDELPSLWNILCGEMSFIGPRPLPTRYLQHYSPEQRRRHLVRGGLSGLAQVSGRNRIHWDDRFDLDTEYVDSVSLSVDLRIVFRTIGIVLRADGISQDGEATADNFGGTLKSDLLVFDEDGCGEQKRSWSVRTTAGDVVGRCDISQSGADAAVILFEAHPDAENDEEVRREVIRLVTNRARATEATFAAWVLPPDSQDLAILANAGFSDCDEVSRLLGDAPENHDDEIVVVCRLWPESVPDAISPQNTPLSCRQMGLLPRARTSQTDTTVETA